MTLEAESLFLAGRLEDVSLRLRPGEVVAVCGPNGAGKSSLLACLAGILAPGRGAVRLDGEALDAMAPRARARALGYLPQAGEVAWDMSVATLAGLGRLPWGGAGGDAVDAALAAMELEEVRARPVSNLSGGERARALLARVLAGEPRWILADEPLAALDLGHASRLMAHFERQAWAGRGVVLVLHDLARAMNHATRVIVLHEGRLVAEGTPREALSPGVIRTVWGVEARWLGEAGARALSCPAITG